MHPCAPLVRIALLALVLAAACSQPPGSDGSDGGGELGFDRDQCHRQCEGDADERALAYCGTDHRTYTGCQWQCADVPAGVGVYPEACQPDGSPAPDGPPQPADGERLCDWSRDADGGWTAIECARNVDADISQMLGTMPMRTSPLSAPRGALPDEVDHRARFGAPRNQQSTMMCTAFATIAAMEGAAGVYDRNPIQLSEMHLWARYHTPRAEAAVRAARAGVASADAADGVGWRFNPGLANDWMNDRAQPDANALRMLDGMAQVEVASVDVMTRPDGRAPPPDAFRQVLADGRDVVVALYTGARQWGPARVGADGIIPDYDLDARGGHAVLLVGYRVVNGQRYFIIRNSWGTRGRGDGGYYYLSERAFAANLIPSAPSFTVTLAPAASAPGCPDGQVGDFDGRCRATCANGAVADETGACPTADCGADRAPDAHGVCVRGCATGTGSTDGVGSYNCTAAACAWTIPAGALGCAAGDAACVRVCGAPFCEGYANGDRFACRGDDL